MGHMETTPSLSMTVLELDGSSSTSDITESARLLFNLGRIHPRVDDGSGTEVFTLTLDGEWTWDHPVDSADVALQHIADGLYHVICVAVGRRPPDAAAD